MANTQRNKARLQALAAAVLFSTGGAGIKVAAFSALQVSMIRSGVAVIALAFWLRGAMTFSPGVLGIGATYAATLTLFVVATKLTTAADAIFLQSTAPLYLLLFAPLVLKESVRRADLVYAAALSGGMVLCFLGEAAVTSTASNPALGDLFGAASGLTWAWTLVTLRRIGRDDGSGRQTLGAVVAGNAIACAAAAPFAIPLPTAPVHEWATLTYLGVFQIALAYIFLSSAIRHLPALEISLLLLIEPVLNPVWTWVFRGENPGRWTIVGGAVILAATALKIRFDDRGSRIPLPSAT
jgi:drug/metabolite transporter (DMT)-like permease